MSDDNMTSGEISDVHMDIEWDDDFQPDERRKFAWDIIADQLRQFPGRWAKIPDAHGSAGTTIRQGRAKAFRQGRWQTATRRGELFIRFLGDDNDTEQPNRMGGPQREIPPHK